MRYTALLLILFAESANAETFKCQAGHYWSSGGKIVVTATINEDGTSGKISVAGTTHETIYYVSGFDRRWDFGSQGDSYRYAFMIKPDGTGLYYDFAGETKAKASSSFACR